MIFVFLLLWQAWGAHARGTGCDQALVLTFDRLTVRTENPWIEELSQDEIAASIKALRNSKFTRFQHATLRSNAGAPFRDTFPPAVPGPVYARLRRLHHRLWSYYVAHKNKFPEDVFIDMRVSSNTDGIRVNRQVLGDNDTGLHSHGYNRGIPRDAIDFIYVLQGPGPLVQQGGRAYQMSAHRMILFGADVKHGSPNSPGDRLVIVGGAHSRYATDSP